MKNLLLTAIALTTASFVSAQFRTNSDKEWYRTEQDEKKFSFGYFLGVNTMSYKVSPKDESYGDNSGVSPDNQRVYLEQKSKPGFSVGVVGKMRINDRFAIVTTPGVHFAQRTLVFTNLNDNTQDLNPTKEVKSTYIDIPLLLKIQGDRWVNTRPYVQGGFGYAYNLQSNEDNVMDNGTEDIFRTTKSNFNWQAEMGIEIYFKRFKLTPSIKGMFFFNNELVPDKPNTPGYANTLNSLKTRALVFSLKFE